MATQDFPRPIPWLGKVGTIEPLDASSPTAPSPVAHATCAPSPTAALPPAPVSANTHQTSTAAPVEAPVPPPSSAAPSGLGAKLSGLYRKYFPKKKRPGSGIPARKLISGLRWGRRFSQVFFLGLFLFLLVKTEFRGSFSGSNTIRTP